MTAGDPRRGRRRGRESPRPQLPELERLRSRLAALEQLVEVQDRAVLAQAGRIEEAARILRSILDSMSDGVAVTDETGRFLHFNPAAAAILGLGPLDVPPSEWPESYGLFLPDKSTPFPADRLPLVRAMRGASVDQESIHVRRAGAPQGIWLSVNARPLRDPEGALRGAVAVFRDVTRAVEAEEALARKADELARSNADLAQFASVASHDLQEPLRMIAGYAGLLGRRYGDRLDAEAAGLLSTIGENAARMTDLVRDLLALSRAGSTRVPPAPADSAALCDRAISNLGTLLAERQAVVTRDPLPVVVGVPTQIVQVFQNLIGNAVKFHGERRPRVHVSAAIRQEEAVFSVRDEGIGIDPASLEEIFQAFRRLHARDEYPGSGLGLAICRRIVERQGGRIWAESEPGQGSTFSFTLPLAAGQRPAGG
jgi:PAS domain S-box-containing protein